jgi:anti-sigma factor RsiW
LWKIVATCARWRAEVSVAPRPTEEELHAYLDGELTADRRAEVTAYLRDHPAEARRLEAYRADGEAIGRLFLRTPQARMSRRAPSSSWRRKTWIRAAAAVLVLAVTFATGLTWYWQGRVDETVWARFGAEALAAHLALMNPDSPPVMTASLGDVAEFFSATVRTPMHLEDPANPQFTLVGSKFLTGAKGRVTQLAFRNRAGVLVTMYFEPWPRKRDAPFRALASQSNVRTIGWTDRELGCAVTGALPEDELERIGNALYAGLVKS